MADQRNLFLAAVTSGKLGIIAFEIADASGSSIWNGCFWHFSAQRRTTKMGSLAAFLGTGDHSQSVRMAGPMSYVDEVARDVAAGRLVPILQDWCPTFPGYYLYHSSRRQTPPVLAALIDCLRHRSR